MRIFGDAYIHLTPAEKLVPGTKISGISFRADHFILKILVPPPSLAREPAVFFRWEEREGEKNTSGHSSQLPMPRRNVIIAAGHAHGMQIKTFTQL